MRDDRSPQPAGRRRIPEIPRSRFALGQARAETYEQMLRLGSFGEGMQRDPGSPRRDHRGRFSEGQELLGDADPEKHIRRGFAAGMDREAGVREQL